MDAEGARERGSAAYGLSGLCTDGVGAGRSWAPSSRSAVDPPMAAAEFDARPRRRYSADISPVLSEHHPPLRGYRMRSAFQVEGLRPSIQRITKRKAGTQPRPSLGQLFARGLWIAVAEIVSTPR